VAEATGLRVETGAVSERQLREALLPASGRRGPRGDRGQQCLRSRIDSPLARPGPPAGRFASCCSFDRAPSWPYPRRKALFPETTTNGTAPALGASRCLSPVVTEISRLTSRACGHTTCERYPDVSRCVSGAVRYFSFRGLIDTRVCSPNRVTFTRLFVCSTHAAVASR